MTATFFLRMWLGRRLDREGALRISNHARAGQDHDALELLAGGRSVGLHGRHAELALDVTVVGHLDDFLHADQLAELLDDLLDDGVIAARRQDDFGKCGIGGHVDRQRVDVEPSAGKEADHPRQLAKTIFDEHGEYVSIFHARSLGSGGSLSASGARTIS